MLWYLLFTSCECKADSRSVAAVCLTPWAIWVTDSSVALLLSALMEALSCSQRERGQRIQKQCFVVSVLGSGLRLFKTELVQRDSFPITDEMVRLSLQRLSGFLSHTLENIFCTAHRDSTWWENFTLYCYISFIFAVLQ